MVIERIIHTRIERPGRHFIFEDADFSIDTIKELIKQGDALMGIDTNRLKGASKDNPEDRITVTSH